MNEVCLGESRCILDDFHIYEGCGERFDLLYYPIGPAEGNKMRTMNLRSPTSASLPVSHAKPLLKHCTHKAAWPRML